jgi:hypothetical protein
MKLSEQDEQLISACLELAFEAGKWAGQVDLEEHYDREQYSQACFESLYARKHSMPLEKPSQNREVTVNLRPDKWRTGVRQSSREHLEKAKEFILKGLGK